LLKVSVENYAGKFSEDFKKPQETITHLGFSWEPESVGNPAGNEFFVQIRWKTVNF
jgi:hypothetical protein